MILEQPDDAVVGAGFFIGGQRENQIAIGAIAFFFQPNKIGDQNCVAVFDVFGAAAVEVAFLFDELERIGGPIFAAGFDNVEMADEQDRRANARAVNAHDKIAVARIGAEELHIAIGKAGASKPRGHSFGGLRGAAHGFGSVDFHELLEDAARQLARFVIESGARSNSDAGGKSQGDSYDGECWCCG